MNKLWMSVLILFHLFFKKKSIATKSSLEMQLVLGFSEIYTCVVKETLTRNQMVHN